MSAGLTPQDVRAALKAACVAEGTAKAWADKAGVSGAYVSDVLKGRREPGDAILGPLGLRRVVSYLSVALPTGDGDEG